MTRTSIARFNPFRVTRTRPRASLLLLPFRLAAAPEREAEREMSTTTSRSEYVNVASGEVRVDIAFHVHESVEGEGMEKHGNRFARHQKSYRNWGGGRDRGWRELRIDPI
jgi:hypothetical protein